MSSTETPHTLLHEVFVGFSAVQEVPNRVMQHGSCLGPCF